MGRSARQAAVVLAALVALTVVVFLPLRNAGFVVSDDKLYVTENPAVRSGFTPGGLLRAVTVPVAANWHPLTVLSLMLDAELFGPGPRGFHLMNVLYHLCAAVLSFLVLRRLTGATWRSALTAALFAVHPLHVESVAWISERKDVLSGVFFWLVLGAYRRYAARPSRGRHALVSGLLVSGLMAKPMLVTVPLLLLVLDGWPLGRLRTVPGNFARLLREKLPWLAIATIFSIVTLIVQARGQALQSLEALPFAWRVQNALAAYGRYLGSTVWPARLSFFHPYPTHAPGVGPALSAFALLAAITILALVSVRRRPALAAGWFWYLGLLVPVIGLIQVGGQTVADRYMYLPLTGVAFAVIWPLADLLRDQRRLRVSAALAAFAIVAVLSVVARAQTRFWESSLSLYNSSLARAEEDEKWLAHFGLAVSYSEEGDRARAAEHYLASIAGRPAWTVSRNNYGTLLLKEGRAPDALAQFQEAIRLAPGEARGYYGEGQALAALGRDEQALRSYRTALDLKPDYDIVYTDLGAAAARLGRLQEAEVAFREAVRRLPEDPIPAYNLGLALAVLGRQQEAIIAFEAVVRLRPAFAEAYNDLGVSYAAADRPAEAVRAFEQALRIEPGLAAARDNLARARAGSAGHRGAPK
ncbi:MAG: tetratricopeptide repeat protein [Candidatus Methylomirabilia bacterium]